MSYPSKEKQVISSSCSSSGSLWKSACCGAAAGIANGLLGAGGGTLLIPLLHRLRVVEDRRLFPTALCVMLPISAISLAVYLLRGTLTVAVALPYCIGGLAGGLLGGLLYQRIPTFLLRLVLGALMLWGGLRILLSE